MAGEKVQHWEGVATMIAGLSHELRNPLNAAVLQLSVLERRLGEIPSGMRPMLVTPLTLARGELQRVVQLLHAFLEVARPVEPTLRPVALGRLVHDVLDLLEIEAALRRVQLTRRFESGPTLQLDQAQLRQVVRHLCLNAVHASPAGGRVEVTIGHEGPFVTLTVDDTGPGVALALRERIFEPFFTTDHTAFGAGLGLPIVRSIVTLHDGALIVTDAPIGGARFVVQLRG